MFFLFISWMVFVMPKMYTVNIMLSTYWELGSFTNTESLVFAWPVGVVTVDFGVSVVVG